MGFDGLLDLRSWVLTGAGRAKAEGEAESNTKQSHVLSFAKIDMFAVKELLELED
jgi:hypothetical protein